MGAQTFFFKKILISRIFDFRLAADRRVFHDMIEELLPFLFPIWQQHHGLLVQNPDQITDELIEKAVLVLKVIRKSVVHGLRKPSENDNAMVFIRTMTEQIPVVLPLRKFFLSARFLTVTLFNVFAF